MSARCPVDRHTRQLREQLPKPLEIALIDVITKARSLQSAIRRGQDDHGMWPRSPEVAHLSGGNWPHRQVGRAVSSFPRFWSVSRASAAA